MKTKWMKNDLTNIETVEHVDDNKRFALYGKFYGRKEKVLLARVGEGIADPRSYEMIKLTADCLTRELISLYGIQARLRRQFKDEGKEVEDTTFER